MMLIFPLAYYLRLHVQLFTMGMLAVLIIYSILAFTEYVIVFVAEMD